MSFAPSPRSSMKSPARKILRFVCVPALAIYPFAVAGALFSGVPVSALPLLLVLVAAISAFGSTLRGVWLVALTCAAALFFTQKEIFLRLYPVLMNAAVAGIFASSLFRKPLIEIFAEKTGRVLDAAGKRYTRRATLAWTVFMAANTLISLATVFLSLRVWTVYNGFVSYLLIGAMFAAEFLVRRRVEKNRVPAAPSVPDAAVPAGTPK